MFKKLKNTFVFENYEIENHKIKFGEILPDGKFRGISYENLKNNDVNNQKIFNVIPKQYRDKFNLLLMQINTSTRPHIDSKILTAINFYIQTANATTFFYKIISNQPKRIRCEVQKARNSGTNFIDKSELQITDSFKALPNEAYLLDVSKPHSVAIPAENTRIAFVLQTTQYTFDEVYCMLEETKNL